MKLTPNHWVRSLVVAMLLLFTLVAGYAKDALAQEIPAHIAEFDLQEAKVYFQEAVVKGAADFSNIPPGRHSLVIPGLSPRIRKQSLQVEGRGDGVLMQVCLWADPGKVRARNQRQKAYQDSLERVQHQIDSLQAHKQAPVKEQEMILKNQELGSEERA